MLITVFTPTYNRSNLLPDLYQSLLRQTSKNFEWLIIDDGSTDDTSLIVENFIKEKILKINYIKVTNGGKHRAINIAADKSLGEYVFIVDSDDILESSAIEIGEKYLSTIDSQLAGVVFRLKYKDGSLVGEKLPFEEKATSYFNIRYNLGYNVDFKEFTRTEILRNYKYPDYKNEKFCSEALVWNRISEDFNFLFVDKAIYICEYLQEGLSANIIMNRRRSSSYALDIYSELYNNNRVPLKTKLKSLINFWRFGWYNKKSFKSKWKLLKYDVLPLVIYPLGCLMILKDELEMKK